MGGREREITKDELLSNSERNTGVVLTRQDPNLLVGRQVVHDQRAIDKNREMP